MLNTYHIQIYKHHKIIPAVQCNFEVITIIVPTASI